MRPYAAAQPTAAAHVIIASATKRNLLVGTALLPPNPLERFALEDVVCHESLGGC